MKIKTLFANKKFTIITLSLAIVCFVLGSVIPEYSYRQNGDTVRFENPESICFSETGWQGIVDSGDSIYCLDDKGALVYAIDVTEFPYENAQIIDITFSPDQHLYCQLAIYNPDAYLTDAEALFEIDAEGNILRELFYYDYSNDSNPPSHQTRIQGLHFFNEQLCYLYLGESEQLLIQADPGNPKDTSQTSIASDGYGEIIQCHSTPDGGFLVLKHNGEVGTISLSGEYQLLYKASYDARKEEGLLPYDVFLTENTLYMLGWQEELGLYRWDDTKFKPLLSVNDSIHMSEDTDLYASGLDAHQGTLILHINEALYRLEADDTLTPYSIDIKLPLIISASILSKDILPFIGICLLLVGIISGIGNLMKWKLSLLSKQLLSTLPLIFILLIVVIATMLISMINLNTEDILREAIAINEIVAAQFTSEELEDMVSYEHVDNGKVSAITKRLQGFINGNQNYWSRNYNLSIYVRTTGENFVCIANSDGANRFLLNSFATDYAIDEEFYEDSHTFATSVGFGEDMNNLNLVLITPIYNADGSYNAVLFLNASQNRLIQAILSTGESLLISVAIWIALLILVMTLVAAHNVRALRQAKDVIAQIAGGDFSVRVEKFSKDEVGEICVGVNEMANRLEQYFNEKNRNEQFYYKFVPEKFKELLHKEEFTDLALGDAQSEDLSILFCDIRAFSLNSEMMTAKESFDFVNRIYGKAGPIIRKHNGFIDKYIGDAIMALFESAEDAVAAGIELYQAITLNPNAKEEFGIPDVKIGIGIHSGMARIGIVGEQERMSGTVISNTVNLSSRMEALTKKYGAGMIISKDTLDRMTNPDALSTRYLGMVQVAGVNEVSALYEVLACLNEEQQQKRENTKLEFREAVRLFHMGELNQALELFRQLSGQDASDYASLLYARYVEDKLIKGDTEHNVFRFENK